MSALIRTICTFLTIHLDQGKLIQTMKKASDYAYLAKPKSSKQVKSQTLNRPGPNRLQEPEEVDLNVFVLTFEGAKEAQKNLAGGDPYSCKSCGAILNKYSIVQHGKILLNDPNKLKASESLWQCQFCMYPNELMIQKEEIPVKDDIVYILQSALQQGVSENDSTIVFCIDVSGSMNTTTEVVGKVDLKFGLSKEQIQMLKQFMEPGDEAQFNFLPGAHNKNKTFVSRMQCVLSAIESQINEIKKADPSRKVGFILFNNQVLVLGDGKAQNVSLVGDRLNNPAEIMNALKEFKLTCPIAESYQLLLNQLNKTEAKGQTALGPALTAAIEVASKGSKGSVVVLCTDGLANIGVGTLEAADEKNKQYYQILSNEAKNKNVAVNIITIKGQSSKLATLSTVVEATNGNVKVVNPEKLSDDFANILKDQVIGVNVEAKIMLHKALLFRNQDPSYLKDSKTILIKPFANATVNTKISFQYEVRNEEELKQMKIDLEKLQKVPFQAQITYSSPRGGRFLRVISSQSKTTNERAKMQSSVNIGVVHQRIVSNTALMYSRGEVTGSQKYNELWSSYMMSNFSDKEYSAQQEKFSEKNKRLNEAISNRISKKQVFIPLPVKKEAALPSVKKELPLPAVKEEKSNIHQVSGKKSFKQKPKFEESIKKTGFTGGKLSRKNDLVPQVKGERLLKKKQIKQNIQVKQEKAVIDSDEDEMELKNFMMEKNQKFD